MLKRLLILITLLFSQFNVLAAECSAVFPDGVQNSSNASDATITFGWDARIINSPDNILATRRPLIDYSGGVSCNTTACSNQQNPTAAEEINFNSFVNRSPDVSVGFEQSMSIAPGDYDDLNMSRNSTLTLDPGIYTFRGSFSVGYQAEIIISSPGTVQILVRGNINVNTEAVINSDRDASNLLLFSRDDISIQSDAKVKAFIYSRENIFVNSFAEVTGAINARGSIDLIRESRVIFVDTVPNFDGLCDGGPTIPISCSANLPVVAFSDNFSQVDSTWRAVNFNRSVSNWPGDSITNSNGENQAVQFQISGGELEINGSLTSNGDNEYGMVHYDLSAAQLNKTAVTEYAIDGDFTANKSGTNNDLGIIFGYQDDENYYLARWVKYGTSYANNSSFPGEYRRLELVKMANGSATLLDSKSDFDVNDPFNLEVVVNSEGTAVCANDTALLYSASEQPVLNDIGILTYDNDIGISVDNINVRCNDCAEITPLAYYAFDEGNWSGSANDVIDEISGLNGRAYGGVNTLFDDPARPGNPGTCRYGEFDGVNDYVQVSDNATLDIQSELTVTTWINPDRLPSSGLMTILSKDENYEFHLTPSGEINWWWQSGAYSTSGANITPGNWYHIAITYKSGQQVIYVNGVNRGEESYTGNLILNSDPLQIGQDQGYPGRYYDGKIDEVKVFDSALSAINVYEIYKETHPCIVLIDHFEIHHDGQGLTCLAEPITIKACADAACTSTDPTATDITFRYTTPSGSTVDKSLTVTGEIQTDLSHFTAENLTLSLVNDNSFKCFIGASEDCNLLFSEAGFVLETATSGNIESCAVDSLTIKAVKLSDDGVSCAPAFTGSQQLDVAFYYANPTLGTLTPNLNSSPMLNVGQLQTRTLTFDASGEVTVPIQYNDAGQLTFEVRERNASGVSRGYLNKVFYPAEFVISSPVSGDSASASTNHVAGEDFELNIQAQCQGGEITPNYSPNTNASTELKVERIAPVSSKSADGNLTLVTGVTKSAEIGADFEATDLISHFISGGGQINSTSANYSEVGLVQLSLQDSNYFGSTIESNTQSLGRFYPSYFVQEIENNGSLIANHSSECLAENWVYSGQLTDGDGSIRYASTDLPKLRITAYNAVDEITKNYIGDFAKLLNFPYSRNTISLAEPEITLVNGLALESDVSAAGLVAEHISEGGVLIYTLPDSHHFTYTRTSASEVSPFDASFDMPIDTISDSDYVKATAPTNTTDLSFSSIASNTVEVRFGRATLANSFGPETSSLPQTLTMEYFDSANNFITNINDNCTAFNADNISLETGTLNKDEVELNSASGFVASGTTGAIELSVKAPAAGKQGSVTVIYDIYDWLKYDWSDADSDDAPNENPSATANFGIYRGNDRIIYYREVNN
ncbi:DUF6701 domain-containing protein [Thalassotalea sp. PLHSN55]|uniref:DUF6701 domain-containing protein n=1 Tax=Thalassotalea sp. PLHSN55 TaxID=3435888 RepID=UPI003F836353